MLLDNIINNFKHVIDRYAQFDGRAGRREFWYFQIACWAIAAGFGMFVQVLGHGIAEVGKNIIEAFLFIPTIAVGARRLHDTGRSGWWQLIALTGVGVIVLLYWAVQPGEEGYNQYGGNPEEDGTDEGESDQQLV